MANTLNTGTTMAAPTPAQSIRDTLTRRYGEAPAFDDILSGRDALARLARRRGHRRYTDRPVDPALLRLLCACALSAPSKSALQQADILIARKADHAPIAGLIPDQ